MATIPLRRLLVLHEPEEACRSRLEARGVDPEVAAEVAFYLAQATDFAAILGEIRDALARTGVDLAWAALDDRGRWLPHLGDPGTLVWCLTDGFAWYRGSLATSAAVLMGSPQLGSPPAVQHLCQDKWRTGAVARAAGVRVPPTLLAEDGVPLTPTDALPAAGPYFVKPNTLGAKLGIGPDSRAPTLEEALDLTRRLWSRYRDRAVVQPYLAGRDVRVSFMDLGGPDPAPLGIYEVRTGASAGFPTLADSLVMTSLKAAGSAGGLAVEVHSLAGTPEAAAIEAQARPLARALGLRDYWSMDFRVDADGRPWFLELEVCPAVTIYDFLTYLRDAHGGLGLPDALARAAPLAHGRRLASGPGPWA